MRLVSHGSLVPQSTPENLQRNISQRFLVTTYLFFGFFSFHSCRFFLRLLLLFLHLLFFLWWWCLVLRGEHPHWRPLQVQRQVLELQRDIWHQSEWVSEWLPQAPIFLLYDSSLEIIQLLHRITEMIRQLVFVFSCKQNILKQENKCYHYPTPWGILEFEVFTSMLIL